MINEMPMRRAAIGSFLMAVDCSSNAYTARYECNAEMQQSTLLKSDDGQSEMTRPAATAAATTVLVGQLELEYGS